MHNAERVAELNARDNNRWCALSLAADVIRSLPRAGVLTLPWPKPRTLALEAATSLISGDYISAHCTGS